MKDSIRYIRRIYVFTYFARLCLYSGHLSQSRTKTTIICSLHASDDRLRCRLSLLSVFSQTILPRMPPSLRCHASRPLLEKDVPQYNIITLIKNLWCPVLLVAVKG